MDGSPMDAEGCLSDRLRALGIGLNLSVDFVATTPRIAQLADRPDEPEARRAQLSAAKADALDRARAAKAAWVDDRAASGSNVEWEGASHVRVDGCDVWLAYARERPPRGWSLGVPVAFEGQVVLLCEDLDGGRHELSLCSQELVESRVSQSRGQWVVRVVRDGDGVRIGGGVGRERLSA